MGAGIWGNRKREWRRSDRLASRKMKKAGERKRAENEGKRKRKKKREKRKKKKEGIWFRYRCGGKHLQ